jgi:hypothetical protein
MSLISSWRTPILKVNFDLLVELKTIGDQAIDDEHRSETWDALRSRYWRARVDDALKRHNAPIGLVFAQQSGKAWAYEPSKAEFLVELARLITTLSSGTLANATEDYRYGAIINQMGNYNPPVYGTPGVPDALKVPLPTVTISETAPSETTAAKELVERISTGIIKR